MTFDLRRDVAATDTMSRTGECVMYRPLIVDRGTPGESSDSLQALSLKFCLAVIFLQIAAKRSALLQTQQCSDTTVLRHTKLINQGSATFSSVVPK
jgi:hypothetical protein